MKCKNTTCDLSFTPKVYNQIYCSPKCANSGHVRKWRENNRKKCHCEALIHKESKQCKTCAHKAKIDKTLTLARYYKLDSVKGKPPSWKNSHIRGLCRSWNKDLLKYPCQRCSYSIHIELCHKKSVSSFKETDLVGEVNDPDNIYVLCRNCHWEFDHGYLSHEQIKPRQ